MGGKRFTSQSKSNRVLNHRREEDEPVDREGLRKSTEISALPCLQAASVHSPLTHSLRLAVAFTQFTHRKCRSVESWLWPLP